MSQLYRRRVQLAVVALAAPLAVAAPASAAPVHHGPPSAHEAVDERVIIGHRGAAGYRPEHTLASYELAARMGADYIEPDLVSTKDGVLVARHEPEISGTTDVADHPEFADRRTTKTVDGVQLTGWFTEDFTLAELKTLRAEERIPDIREENTLYNGLFEIPTFDEVLALRDRLSKELGRQIGVYPETKHPTYFDSIDLSLEEPLLASLRKAHLNRANSPVFIQSFETTNLRQLHDAGVKLPLMQLLSAEGAKLPLIQRCPPGPGPADLVAAGDPRTYADLSSAAAPCCEPPCQTTG